MLDSHSTHPKSSQILAKGQGLTESIADVAVQESESLQWMEKGQCASHFVPRLGGAVSESDGSHTTVDSLNGPNSDVLMIDFDGLMHCTRNESSSPNWCRYLNGDEMAAGRALRALVKIKEL